MGKTEKKDRSNLIAIACVIACVCFAYGYSNQNAWFQWKLPLALVLGAGLWALLPRRIGKRESGESA